MDLPYIIILYLLRMRKRKSGEDVSACTDAKPDERLDAEVAQHIVELIGQLVHRRVNIAATKGHNVSHLAYTKVRCIIHCTGTGIYYIYCRETTQAQRKIKQDNISSKKIIFLILPALCQILIKSEDF